MGDSSTKHAVKGKKDLKGWEKKKVKPERISTEEGRFFQHDEESSPKIFRTHI